MKRFLVIAYDQYYPSGFPDEIRDSKDTIEEAMFKLSELNYDYKYIFDCDTRKIVHKEDNYFSL